MDLRIIHQLAGSSNLSSYPFAYARHVRYPRIQGE